MDDFATWLHQVALPFSRAICSSGWTSVEWEWQVDSDPLLITQMERIMFERGAQHDGEDNDAAYTRFRFEADVVYSAHQQIAIARHEPAVLAGFHHAIAALHARVATTQTLRYRFLFHDASAPHPVLMSSTAHAANATSVRFMPVSSAHDLDAFVHKVCAVHAKPACNLTTLA